MKCYVKLKRGSCPKATLTERGKQLKIAQVCEEKGAEPPIGSMNDWACLLASYPYSFADH